MTGKYGNTTLCTVAVVVACVLSPPIFALEIDNIEIIDLGTLAGNQESVASDINDEGEIVGRSFTRDVTHSQAFIYRGETLERLPTPEGKEGAAATAINNDGVVVGYATHEGYVNRAVLWRRSGSILLEPDPTFGDWSHASDINNAGEVAGGMGIAAVVWSAPTARPDSYVQLRDPSLDSGPHALGASAINDSGAVSGTNQRRDSAFYYRAGQYYRLSGGSASDDYGNGINQYGAIVGTVGIEASEPPRVLYHAVLWTDKDSEFQDLGTLGGDMSQANDLNDLSIVVGASDLDDDSSAAFVWHEDFGMQALPGLGGSRSFASSINALGHVVGASETAEGNMHATLWKITYSPRIRIPIFSFENLACIPFINCPSPVFWSLLILIIPVLALGSILAIRQPRR